ncbi:MAG: hypothetical protein FJY65_03210 [Calditrichaeota bacterium]|nr:hypothetical protein [Calditrichota bacterium]
MNKWVEKSIELANSEGYLDKLHSIYPVRHESLRELDPKIKEELKKIYYCGNNTSLIKYLLNMPKFPINDPYIAFLRKNEIFIKYNPNTVNRIVDRIKSIGFDEMIQGIIAPKVATKQFGALFNMWLKNLGFRILSEPEFESNHKGVALLEGGDLKLLEFANKHLACELDKRPDFLIKVNKTYVIGETKFLSAIGGGQDRGFDDALKLVKGKAGTATRIAVLDGIIWIRDGAKIHKIVSELEETALSALILVDYLKWLLDNC